LSAFFAGLTAILSKIGVAEINHGAALARRPIDDGRSDSGRLRRAARSVHRKTPASSTATNLDKLLR
jgi:hypothetical protein